MRGGTFHSEKCWWKTTLPHIFHCFNLICGAVVIFSRSLKNLRVPPSNQEIVRPGRILHQPPEFYCFLVEIVWGKHGKKWENPESWNAGIETGKSKEHVAAIARYCGKPFVPSTWSIFGNQKKSAVAAGYGYSMWFSIYSTNTYWIKLPIHLPKVGDVNGSIIWGWLFHSTNAWCILGDTR